jgi:rsbT co-antagonist protein RsbR
VEAVKLLGAEVVLTGVSPSIAQSVVHLGIDLSDITTKTTLAEGLKHVFERQTPWEIDD